MAFAGFKKQLNKANQFVTEKLGGAEGTKLTEEYTELEKKTDTIVELMNDLVNKTGEYLQPNPTTRARLMVTSKVTQTKTHAYPQPEGTLGESMVRASRRMGEGSAYADALNEAGEALKQMAEVKYALEDNVKQNILEPLTQVINKDVRDIQFHRKKLEGRRLDYDCKRRRATGTFVTPEDMKQAEAKFEESYNSAAKGMFTLITNEAEQISQLAALSEALFEYHSQCASILESLTSRLIQQKELAAEKVISEYRPKRLSELSIYPEDGGPPQPPATEAKFNCDPSPLPSPVRSPARTPVSRGPCCQALYDFEAENPGELAFKQGDIITLLQKIDDNWLQGQFNGKIGMFPTTYVLVLVPLH